MHLYTEGNSPSLRALLGVGWNRTLPAPFGFGNGIWPDGVNDHLLIPSFKAKNWSDIRTFTLEYWTNIDVTISGLRSILSITLADLSTMFVNMSSMWYINGNFPGSSYPAPGSSAVGMHHVVLTVNYTTKAIRGYLDGSLTVSTTVGTFATVDTNNPVISFFRLLCREGTSEFMNKKTDEIRFYNRILSFDEVRLNYNAGAGNNPSMTEGLWFWYDFQTAEPDTSLWPGGIPLGWTSGAWGVRDKTPNGYHAMQVNMANNSTLGGTIQTF